MLWICKRLKGIWIGKFFYNQHKRRFGDAVLIYFSHHTMGTVVEPRVHYFVWGIVHLKKKASLHVLNQTRNMQMIFSNIAKKVISFCVVMIFTLNRVIIANLRTLLGYYACLIIAAIFEKNFLKKSDTAEVGRLMYLQMMFIVFAVVAINVTDRLLFPGANNDDN